MLEAQGLPGSFPRLCLSAHLVGSHDRGALLMLSHPGPRSRGHVIRKALNLFRLHWKHGHAPKPRAAIVYPIPPERIRTDPRECETYNPPPAYPAKSENDG